MTRRCAAASRPWKGRGAMWWRCTCRPSAEGSRPCQSWPRLDLKSDICRERDPMPDSILPDSTRLKFGVGQPVPRNEDPILLQGRGRYTDDIDLPGQLYAVMVRSPYAHGIIRGIDTAAAKDVPGVLGVYTGADLAGSGF